MQTHLRTGVRRQRLLPELVLLTMLSLVAELVLLARRGELTLLGEGLPRLTWLARLRRSLVERLLLVGLDRLLGLRLARVLPRLLARLLGLGVLGELLRRRSVTARLTGVRILRRLRW
ncbi:hypothetical protein AB0I34_24370 [Kribbella sp. NPDC050281]|uniref:hypothetical protein n=1 Tax=Kribbella sp. NPDC050281 TaxID=3155515 RepID=UPI0033E799D3